MGRNDYRTEARNLRVFVLTFGRGDAGDKHLFLRCIVTNLEEKVVYS